MIFFDIAKINPAYCIVNVTQNVLELAQRCKIKSMVYLSSMEVYGIVECPGGCRVAEWEAGNGRVDILHKRSCYPLGKRMAENICYSYFKEYNVPVKIARLAQTFGRGILPSDHRVFAEFARKSPLCCERIPLAAHQLHLKRRRQMWNSFRFVTRSELPSL